jgi:hypothetical protein
MVTSARRTAGNNNKDSAIAKKRTDLGVDAIMSRFLP